MLCTKSRIHVARITQKLVCAVKCCWILSLVRKIESHSDGKRGTNRQSYKRTEREKAKNVTGPRNVTGGEIERKRVLDTSRHQPISMDD